MSFLDQFRVSDNVISDDQQEIPQQQNLSIQQPQNQDFQQDFFSQFQVQEQPKEEGFFQQAAREFNPLSEEESPFETGAGVSLRQVASGAGGFFGNLEELFRSGGRKVEEILGVPSEEQIEEELGISIPIPRQIFPTSEKIEKTFDDLTDNRFKELAQDAKTKKVADAARGISEDFVSFVTPLGPLKGMNLLRSFGTAVFSNLAAQGLADIGIIDEKNKDFTKFGLNIFSSFVRPNAILEAGKGFLNSARNALKGTVITDNNAPQQISNAIQKISSAGGTEVNPRAVNFGKQLLKDFETGTFEGQKLTMARENLNKLRTSVGPRSNEGKALGSIRKSLENIGENIGENNPEFIKDWREGNQLFQAANTRNILSDFVRDLVPTENLKKIPPELLSLVGLGVPITGAKSLPLAIPASMIANGLLRLSRFPAVQRLYLGFLTDAISGNLKSGLNKFNQLTRAFDATKTEEDKKNQS